MSTKERVTRVIDGDTFMTNKRKRAVRLANVDTPEKGERDADAATQFLMTLIAGKEVTVVPVARDTYGRAVAKVSVEGRSVERAVKKWLSSRKSEPGSEFRLANEVGNGRINQKEDIIWLKNAMGHLGRYRQRGEAHGYIDRDLHDAIRRYQSDRGLRQDGFLKPSGKTECTIHIELARLNRE